MESLFYSVRLLKGRFHVKPFFLMHTQEILFPARLTCGKNSGCLTWLRAVSIHVVAFLPCPPRFAGKNSGLLSRPVFCGKKLGLSDWLIAFSLRLCPLSYPARLTLREILYRVSSRPVLISGKKPGRFGYLPFHFSDIIDNTNKNLYPARLIFGTQLFSGFSSRPVLLCGKTRVYLG